jgi:c-di-GMP-binding flagellar brake protein YcgR
MQSDAGKRNGSDGAREFVEARRHPRFMLDVELQVYPHNSQPVRGHTVDISRSGISVMLLEEVAVGEIVQLVLTLPFGYIEVHAMVRNRHAFRYGFQFVELSSAHDPIGRTCAHLGKKDAAAGASG